MAADKLPDRSDRTHYVGLASRRADKPMCEEDLDSRLELSGQNLASQRHVSMSSEVSCRYYIQGGHDDFHLERGTDTEIYLHLTLRVFAVIATSVIIGSLK